MQNTIASQNKSMTYDAQVHQSLGKTGKSKHAAFWVGLSAAIIILPLLVASLAIVLFEINQWNIPGVFVADQYVGLMDPAETAGLIDRTWNQDRQIRLVSSENPQEVISLKAQNLGYWVDPAATAQAAYAVARGAEPFADVLAAVRGETRIVLPILHFDSDAAQKTLQAIAEEITIPAQNARIAYQDGAWIALPGSPGQTLDIEATLEHLHQNAFTNLFSQTATLFIKPLAPTITDLSPVLDEIDAVISTDLSMTAYDPITDEYFSWHVPDETKREWVRVSPESLQVHLSFKDGNLETLISKWESDLGEGRTFAEDMPEWDSIVAAWENEQTVHATIWHEPTAYNVSPGESLWSISLKLGIPMWYILDANPGLSTNNITAGMTLTIPSLNALLPLPIVENKRIVVDISDQQMSIYENGEILKSHRVSTGVDDSPTMTGIFQVQSHEINAYASNWDLYMPHFMGIYEAWPGFMNGIHGLPMLSNGHRLWSGSLGSPVSYGCIILDLDAAEELYDWADPGVVVEIID